MKRPMFNVRGLLLIIAVAALGLALAIEHRRSDRLAVAVELGDREIDAAEGTIESRRAALAECGENLDRADAELRVGESADPR